MERNIIKNLQNKINEQKKLITELSNKIKRLENESKKSNIKRKIAENEYTIKLEKAKLLKYGNFSAIKEFLNQFDELKHFYLIQMSCIVSKFLSCISKNKKDAAKYKATPIYYYNGELFDVTKESSWLLGFSLTEVTLSYSGTFGFLSTLYLLGLLFINPKQDLKKFLIFASIGLVGLVSLLTVPNKEALLLLVPSFIIGLCFRFIPRTNKAKKVVNILFFATVGIVVVCLIVAILNNYVSSVANIIKSNVFLRKAFNGNIHVYLIIDELSSEQKETIKNIIASFKLLNGQSVIFDSSIVRLVQKINFIDSNFEYGLTAQ